MRNRLQRLFDKIIEDNTPRKQPPAVLGQARLKGPMYSWARPVLVRGRRRTLAIKLAHVQDWHDPKANLYGVYPCPKCGEAICRAAFKRSNGLIIECAACGDWRPVRESLTVQ